MKIELPNGETLLERAYKVIDKLWHDNTGRLSWNDQAALGEVLIELKDAMERREIPIPARTMDIYRDNPVRSAMA